MDPASSDISTFEDGKGSLSYHLDIAFQPCVYHRGKGSEPCLSFDDYHDWFKHNLVITQTFIVSKFADFSERDYYMKDSFQLIDSMHGLVNGSKSYVMKLNQV